MPTPPPHNMLSIIMVALLNTHKEEVMFRDVYTWECGHVRASAHKFTACSKIHHDLPRLCQSKQPII